MWDAVRYSLWAPFYDGVLSWAGFDRWRHAAVGHLGLRAGARVLIVGAGTGLDLDHLPRNINVTAIDVTPAMLARLRRRAGRLGLVVDCRVMDARRLQFADGSFDAAILHLILSVMPEPSRGVREVARVLVPGGRISVFDKFLGDTERASLPRRAVNLLSRVLATDINRRLGELVASSGLSVERNEPAGFGGRYRVITLRKPDPHAASGLGAGHPPM